MPKMTLTDEEKRHIEQRRDSEKKFNLGWNDALNSIQSFLFDFGSTIDKSMLNSQIQSMKRVIR